MNENEAEYMLTDEDYLKKVGVAVSHPNYMRCLEIMKSYGENRWWLSKDAKRRAYYQALESTQSGLLLLSNVRDYCHDLFELFGRPVATHELISPEKVFQEAEEAWQQGFGRAKQEGQKRLLHAMETLKELLPPEKRMSLSVRERGGMHLGLESPAQIKRAQRLVAKNPGKYAIEPIFPGGDPSPVPRLYYWAYPEPEDNFIMQWIRSGRGTEPS